MKAKGQMLVELVVGVGIIIVVLVGMVILSTQSVKTGRVSGNRGEATAFAEAELELVKKTRDEDVAAFFSLEGPQVCITGSEPKAGYSCESNYELDQPEDDQMTVSVTINWSDGSVTIQTILAKR